MAARHPNATDVHNRPVILKVNHYHGGEDMKEIKAYIRTSCLDRTVDALNNKGATGITIVTVHPVGYNFGTRFSLSEQEISRKYYDITKIEMVCDAKELDTYLDVIMEQAHTGSSGDGLIFVSDVSEVIKIRTRKRGSNTSILTG